METIRHYSTYGKENTILVKNYPTLKKHLQAGSVMKEDDITFERKVYLGMWKIKYKK